jgi:penicillin-binding protein A
MRRREALAALLAAPLQIRRALAAEQNAADAFNRSRDHKGAVSPIQSALTALMESAAGSAAVVDVRARRLLASHGAFNTALLPPASTLKPFALAALLEARKLRAEETFRCPGLLRINGRSFACSHPPIATPLDVRAALAYSCNCFTAHFAARFEAGELARYLERAGMASRTGLGGAKEAIGVVSPAQSREANQLQALGSGGVQVTPLGLAVAYRFLAAQAPEPVLAGLEDAVEYGSGRLASVEGWKVAGKTGSIRDAAGARIAWFAGFAPSRAPQVALALALQGRSGGGDAAPVAARILAACKTGAL